MDKDETRVKLTQYRNLNIYLSIVFIFYASFAPFKDPN